MTLDFYGQNVIFLCASGHPPNPSFDRIWNHVYRMYNHKVLRLVTTVDLCPAHISHITCIHYIQSVEKGYILSLLIN